MCEKVRQKKNEIVIRLGEWTAARCDEMLRKLAARRHPLSSEARIIRSQTLHRDAEKFIPTDTLTDLEEIERRVPGTRSFLFYTPAEIFAFAAMVELHEFPRDFNKRTLVESLQELASRIRRVRNGENVEVIDPLQQTEVEISPTTD